MPQTDDTRYQQARRRFDELEIEEQSRFLIEATASTLADGVRQAGALLADGIEQTLRGTRKKSASSPSRREPGAAEPETAQRRRPRSGTDGPHESS